MKIQLLIRNSAWPLGRHTRQVDQCDVVGGAVDQVEWDFFLAHASRHNVPQGPTRRCTPQIHGVVVGCPTYS